MNLMVFSLHSPYGKQETQCDGETQKEERTQAQVQSKDEEAAIYVLLAKVFAPNEEVLERPSPRRGNSL
jgi:hypothetical protein